MKIPEQLNRFCFTVMFKNVLDDRDARFFFRFERLFHIFKNLVFHHFFFRELAINKLRMNLFVLPPELDEIKTVLHRDRFYADPIQIQPFRHIRQLIRFDQISRDVHLRMVWEAEINVRNKTDDKKRDDDI